MAGVVEDANGTAAGGPGWSVRPYQPGDEAGITALFEQVFQRPMTTVQYRWKVVDMPWRLSQPNAWVAVDGQRIIGHYAGTPLRLKLGRNEVPAVHGCDVMTDPAYRRHGVLSALGETANAAWTASEAVVQYALQYAGWGSRLAYLGWQGLFPALWLARPLHAEHAAARRYPRLRIVSPLLGAGARAWHAAWNVPLRAGSSGVSVERVGEPGAEFDALWAALKEHYEATIVRDRAWVAYRYHAAPGYDYRLLLARRGTQPAGYLAYRLTSDAVRTTGWIMDLFAAPQDRGVRAALLRAALDDMYSAGAGSARALAPAGVPLERELRRFGFFESHGTYDISLVPHEPDMPHPALRDPQRWLVMLGDFDAL